MHQCPTTDGPPRLYVTGAVWPVAQSLGVSGFLLSLQYEDVLNSFMGVSKTTFSALVLEIR